MVSPRIRWKSVFSACALLAVAACGGGGSSSTPVITSKYPLDTAMSAYHQMAHSYTLKGSAGSDHFTLDLQITPGTQAAFQGVQGMTEMTVASETKNGVASGGDTATAYFLTTPYTQLGASHSSGLVEVDSHQQALPELADAGASGSFDQQKYYSDSSLTSEVGTGTRTWNLTALTSDTAQFCIQDTDDIGGPSETEIDCYDMDIKGNVTAFQVTLESATQTIVFK